MANSAAHLVDRVLPRVAVRQFVRSLPRVIDVIIGAAGVYLVFFERALARDAAAALRPRSVT